MTAWVAVVQPCITANPQQVVVWVASLPCIENGVSARLALHYVVVHLSTTDERDERFDRAVLNRQQKEADGVALEESALLSFSEATANGSASSAPCAHAVGVHCLLSAGWVRWCGLYRHGVQVSTGEGQTCWILLPFTDDDAFEGEHLQRTTYVAASKVSPLWRVQATTSDSLLVSSCIQVIRTPATGAKSWNYRVVVEGALFVAHAGIVGSGTKRSLQQPQQQQRTRAAHLEPGVHESGDADVDAHERGLAPSEAAAALETPARRAASQENGSGAGVFLQQLQHRLEAEIEAWIDSKRSLMLKEAVARRAAAWVATMDRREMERMRAALDIDSSSTLDSTATMPDGHAPGQCDSIPETAQMIPMCPASELDMFHETRVIDASSASMNAEQSDVTDIMLDSERAPCTVSGTASMAKRPRASPRTLTEEAAESRDGERPGATSPRYRKIPCVDILRQKLLWSLDWWHALLVVRDWRDAREPLTALANSRRLRLVLSTPQRNLDAFVRCYTPAVGPASVDHLFSVAAPAHQVSGHLIICGLVSDVPTVHCHSVQSIRVPETMLDLDNTHSNGASHSDRFAPPDTVFEMVVVYPPGARYAERNLCHWWRRLRDDGRVVHSEHVAVEAIVEPDLVLLVLRPRIHPPESGLTLPGTQRTFGALLREVAARIRNSLPAGGHVLAQGQVTTCLQLLDALELQIQMHVRNALQSQASSTEPKTDACIAGFEERDFACTGSQKMIDIDRLIALLEETLARTRLSADRA